MALQTEFESNVLSNMTFIAGTDYTLTFPVYDSNGDFKDISSSTMKWLLCPYGQSDYPILEKTASLSGSSTFVVSLTNLETKDLGGVYLQQIEISNVSGCTIRPAEGVVVIKKAIPTQI